MTIKVLVVDDSQFFRRMISDIINADPDMMVVDVAADGKEGVEKAKKLKPDVITMDIEMPVMDGISAVKEIMKASPIPILMFSSLTHEGAQATLDALEAGAVDFIPKKFEDLAKTRDEAASLLQQRVKEISKKIATPANVETVKPVVSKDVSAKDKPRNRQYEILALGTSTGGPLALQKILTRLPADFPMPIVIIQHMPAAFTSAFAQRLNGLCEISVKEAADGDQLEKGSAYLAPGGMQMMIEGNASSAKVKIFDGGEKINYKPSVDITFGSLAKIYGGNVLSIILTGMGSDGRDGARMLMEQGSTIWAQDEETSVVYGMPQAVFNAGIASESLSIERVSERILSEIKMRG